jgi:hypothetical protein
LARAVDHHLPGTFGQQLKHSGAILLPLAKASCDREIALGHSLVFCGLRIDVA